MKLQFAFLTLFIFSVDTKSEDAVSSIQQTSNIHQHLDDRMDKIEEQIKGFDDLDDLETKIEKRLNQTEHNLQAITQQINTLTKFIKVPSNSYPSKTDFPKNCQEIKDKGFKTDGIYTIQPEFSFEPFLVFCDLNTRGGGWTYFLNRLSGSQDFHREWNEYKHGFGNLAEEFWLGLEKIHALTGYEPNELLIELEDWESQKVHAHYSLFSIGNEKEHFYLKLLGTYSGDAGDSFSSHAAMRFTTSDRDNDRYKGGNCASYYSGGWWYKNCLSSHLTGKYMRGKIIQQEEYKGVFWKDFHGSLYSLKKAKMMVRPLKTEDD